MLAVMGMQNALSGLITEKLYFLIFVIVIAGPMVKSRKARKEMALRTALHYYAGENMYIWVNALRLIQAIFQTYPICWRNLEKLDNLEKLEKICSVPKSKNGSCSSCSE
jgi:hypothetical protein